jgi:hypothetical protein
VTQQARYNEEHSTLDQEVEDGRRNNHSTERPR